MYQTLSPLLFECKLLYRRGSPVALIYYLVNIVRRYCPTANLTNIPGQSPLLLYPRPSIDTSTIMTSAPTRRTDMPSQNVASNF